MKETKQEARRNAEEQATLAYKHLAQRLWKEQRAAEGEAMEPCHDAVKAARAEYQEKLRNAWDAYGDTLREIERKYVE